MSYIKINLGGVERGLKFNIYGIEKMTEKMRGKSVMAFAYAMIWGGLQGNSYAKEEEPEYTFDQVIDWTDDLPGDEKNKTIEDVTRVLMSTQGYKDLIKRGAEVLKAETDVEKKREIEQPVMPT